MVTSYTIVSRMFEFQTSFVSYHSDKPKKDLSFWLRVQAGHIVSSTKKQRANE